MDIATYVIPLVRNASDQPISSASDAITTTIKRTMTTQMVSNTKADATWMDALGPPTTTTMNKNAGNVLQIAKLVHFQVSA